MSIKKHIPNLISLCNITSGTLSIYFAFTHSIELAVWLMLLAALFDLLDGWTARKLFVFSPLGKDIDSLCDVVSFGVAPAMMMAIALHQLGSPVALVAVLIAPSSAYRLAKFNNDVRQTTSFIGLPTPASAIFFAGLAAWIVQEQEMLMVLPRMIEYKVHGLFVVLILGFSYLMISEVPMFSLKEKGSREHYLRIGVVALLGVAGAVLWGWLGLSIAIFSYVFLNLLPLLRRSAIR
ncbi:MAG: CDP-diacylglycerol--serine O-phosphatidyltransferase [Porphyromonas sp.]|nr:CDP-diacylglycerol--serine O-phosphatidyltransferase [Porphyromonas sp.]